MSYKISLAILLPMILVVAPAVMPRALTRTT